MHELGLTKSTKINVQPRICSHMNYISTSPDLDRAMIYLKLIEDGCDEKSAMKFASKNVCMSDSTLQKDGPANFRKLKVKHRKNEITLNGWINMGLDYEMGRGFSNLSKDIVATAEANLKQPKSNISKEDQQKAVFVTKMNRMNNFLKDTYQKYSFNLQNKKETEDKVDMYKHKIENMKSQLKNFQADREALELRNKFSTMKKQVEKNSEKIIIEYEKDQEDKVRMLAGREVL